MCILRACFERSSGDLVQSSGIAFVVQDEDGGQEDVAFAGDPPTASVLDFSDEAVDVESFEETGDAGTPSATLDRVCGWREELLANIPVGDAHPIVLCKLPIIKAELSPPCRLLGKSSAFSGLYRPQADKFPEGAIGERRQEPYLVKGMPRLP